LAISSISTYQEKMRGRPYASLSNRIMRGRTSHRMSDHIFVSGLYLLCQKSSCDQWQPFVWQCKYAMSVSFLNARTTRFTATRYRYHSYLTSLCCYI
jgi:hypothetical protein